MNIYVAARRLTVMFMLLLAVMVPVHADDKGVHQQESTFVPTEPPILTVGVTVCDRTVLWITAKGPDGKPHTYRWDSDAHRAQEERAQIQSWVEDGKGDVVNLGCPKDGKFPPMAEDQ